MASAYNSNDGRYNDGHTIKTQIMPSGKVQATFIDPDGNPVGSREFGPHEVRAELAGRLEAELAGINPSYAEKFIGHLIDAHKAERESAVKRSQSEFDSGLRIKENIAKLGAEAAYREPDLRKNFMTVKGAEGEGERILAPVAGGGLTDVTPGVGGGSSASRPLPRETSNAVRSAVFGLYKVSDMAGMDPATQEKTATAMQYGSALMQANKGSDNAAALDVNTAAVLGSNIAEGKLKIQNFQDRQGQIWKGVDWNGRKLLLDMQPQPTAQPSTSVQGAGSRQTAGKITATEMKVSPDTQAARDQKAGNLIAGEYGTLEQAQAGLAELDKAIASARASEQKRVLQSERNRLALGIRNASGVIQAPAAAVAMLKSNPNLSSQFKEKYGYLPEEN